MENIVKSLEQPYNVGSFNIVCLGDSFTHGAFESDREMCAVFDFDAVYHSCLKRMLNKRFPSRIINMINSGIGGDTAYNALNRFERDVIAYHPDLVIISFCANDLFHSLDEYLGALEKMFKKLKEFNIPTVLLSAYPMCSEVSDNIHKKELRECAAMLAEFQNTGRTDEFQHCAAALAKRYSVKVCNCYDVLVEKYGSNFTKMLANHINHPVRELHMFFAAELYKTIIG